MNSHQFADAVIVFCITTALIVFDCLIVLASVCKKGIFINQQELLMKKTKKELKIMVGKVRGISNFSKPQLVDLLITQG